MTNHVHSANSAHAGILAALHTAVFPHAAWSEQAFLGLLNHPGSLALLHDSGGFLILRIILDEAEILTFGTTVKRQGVGSALFFEGLERLKQAGVQQLHLEVAASNQPAQLFYKKFGFIATGQRKAYYDDGDDALTMRLLCWQSKEAETHE